MRKFALGEANWLSADTEQFATDADFAVVNRGENSPNDANRQTPGPPRSGTHPAEPNSTCAQTRPQHHQRTANFKTVQILWSARLTSAFVARALPPVPTLQQPSHNQGRGTKASDANDPYRDIQYRNPAGQLVVRPGMSTESRPASEIEWSVQNILRRKYPLIHREILVGALEYAGYIQPGADPDFPDSVVGILPPNERFRNGPLMDPEQQHHQKPNRQINPHQHQEQRQP